MQELTRPRRNKYEDAETFGKRLRELLDTLYSVGKHGDRSYYEEMVIEQYTNQLDINVSLGVRISKPLTLESAIMAAMQEEARLVHSKPFYNGSPTSHFKQNDAPRVSQQRNIPSRNFIGTQPQHHHPSNIVNRQNVSIPFTTISRETQAESDSMSAVTISENQLISTNHTQPDNENSGIPILTDAIDRQLKQFHIRSTPGFEYRVDNRSTNSKTVIKDVFIPINNTEQEIICFLKEHTIAGRIFHCYFYNEELYLAFSRVYTTIFNDRGPKLIRCTTRVTFVENKNEQQELIKKYHEGKTAHRDTKFDNDVIKEICALHNIHIHFTTPYNPNSNSPIERNN
ncbi:unnamed protein product [Leptidea sinapis]|uniref:Integrase catalytic domain-containing protein n=1 Tax=Leptidea sinapis TaxID=189913 RepID=A0A5E4R3R7_9NEOP|nr:unnamed protein product [Leptidea sinapis]